MRLGAPVEQSAAPTRLRQLPHQPGADSAQGYRPLAGLITTFPKHWLEHYRCDGLIEIDPILRHCRRELVPLFWDSERRRARGRSRHFWEQREQHGLRSGVSIPLRYEMLREP